VSTPEAIDTVREPAAAPVGPPPPPPPGPIAQSVAIGFRAVYAAGLVLLLIWLLSNVREIASDSQAVVLRFGRIVHAQQAGLLLAWPRPIEQVEILPGPARELSRQVATLPSWSTKSEGLVGPFGAAQPAIPENVASYLTGDGNVVLLNATLLYRITDPIAYALEQKHVALALDRLFRATAVQVTAGRRLNAFLVVQNANPNGANTAVMAMRSEVRDFMLDAMNARLAALATAGAPLGVKVDRIDMTAWLPPEAKSAFDAVLLATEAADKGVAVARTDAERRRQEANQEHDELLSAAQATATEMVADARVNTARILALAREETPETRKSLLLREYRDEISQIMNRVGSAILIDPRSGVRFVMPGKRK
jgi:modulator of FtsH protease HflK